MPQSEAVSFSATFPREEVAVKFVKRVAAIGCPSLRYGCTVYVVSTLDEMSTVRIIAHDLDGTLGFTRWS